MHSFAAQACALILFSVQLCPSILNSAYAEPICSNLINPLFSPVEVHPELARIGVRHHQAKVKVGPDAWKNVWVIDAAPRPSDGSFYHPWNRRAYLIQKRVPGFRAIYSPEFLKSIGAAAAVDPDQLLFVFNRKSSVEHRAEDADFDIFFSQYGNSSVLHEWMHFEYFTRPGNHPLLSQIKAISDDTLIGEHEGYSRYLHLTELATIPATMANEISGGALRAIQKQYGTFFLEKQKLEAKRAQLLETHLKTIGLSREEFDRLDPISEPVLNYRLAVEHQAINEALNQLEALPDFGAALTYLELIAPSRAENFLQMLDSTETHFREIEGLFESGKISRLTQDNGKYAFQIQKGNLLGGITLSKADSGFGFPEWTYVIQLERPDGKKFEYQFMFRPGEPIDWVEGMPLGTGTLELESKLRNLAVSRSREIRTRVRPLRPLIEKYQKLIQEILEDPSPSSTTQSSQRELAQALMKYWIQ